MRTTIVMLCALMMVCLATNVSYSDPLFGPPVNYGVGDSPFSVFSAELDGDGDYDLAVANWYSNNVSILKNNGDGTFQVAVIYGVGQWPNSLFCTDLDIDGDFDLTVANYGSNNVSVLLNNGDGTFGPADNYPCGIGSVSVFSIDLDSDRVNDLVVADHGSDSISLLINLTPTPCCDVSMTPDNSPIFVPRGGTFGITGTISNPTLDPIVTDVWVGVKVVTVFFQLWSFSNIPLNPGQSLSAHLNQYVPYFAPPGEYMYVSYCGDYNVSKCDSFSFPFTVTGVRIEGGASEWTLEGGWDVPYTIPSEYALTGSYPNPFNATTSITYELPEASQVSVEVYNLLGQKVTTLVDGRAEAGQHSVTWDGANYSSGIYFYKLTAGGKTFTKRMTLLK